MEKNLLIDTPFEVVDNPTHADFVKLFDALTSRGVTISDISERVDIVVFQLYKIRSGRVLLDNPQYKFSKNYKLIAKEFARELQLEPVRGGQSIAEYIADLRGVVIQKSNMDDKKLDIIIECLEKIMSHFGVKA